MKQTQLKIRPPLILLTCPLEEGYKSQQIGWGAKFDKTYKAFKMPFCPETLVMIHRLFDNPVVIEGQEHIDEMKRRMKNNADGKKAMALEVYPKPNRKFKLSPYDHQGDGLHYLNAFDGGAIFADCGTGKTAMTLWDIETKCANNQLRPESVLIVGKLMTLFSGWASDFLKFTDITSEVLWEPSKSKITKGEIIDEKDWGKKPAGKARTLSKMSYIHKTGEPAILEGPRAFNPKKHRRVCTEWKQVGDIKYGKETSFIVEKENLRADSIRHKIANPTGVAQVINHEGLLHFEKELIKRKYDYIVIDESTAIKNPTAKIVKVLNKIAASTRYKRILSGTPSPQGPQDLWSQFYFLDGGLTFGPNYKEFLEQHFEMFNLGSHENGTFCGRKSALSPPNKKNTMGWVQGRLRNRIFTCKLRDCIDLPPLTEDILDVYLEPEQQKHYENMKESFCTQIKDERVEVTVDLAKILKLRQITGGFILNKEGKVISVSKTNPKFLALQSAIDEIPKGEKIIIFAIHRAEIKMLLEKFGKRAVAIYGGVSDVKKLNAQDQFINNPDVDRIILQPQSAAYGVNGLTVARYMFFYSIDYRSDTVYQAIKRIERNGQTRAMFVKFLLAVGTIDRVLYDVVKGKDMIQQETIDTRIFRQVTGISPLIK